MNEARSTVSTVVGCTHVLNGRADATASTVNTAATAAATFTCENIIVSGPIRGQRQRQRKNVRPRRTWKKGLGLGNMTMRIVDVCEGSEEGEDCGQLWIAINTDMYVLCCGAEQN